MKRAGQLIPSIITADNMRLAFVKAVRGKRHTRQVVEFEKNLDENLRCLAEEIRTCNRRWGPYYRFTIFDPKEREIKVAPLGDRVAHHALMNICEPFFENYQIFDSYASRRGKGQFADWRQPFQILPPGKGRRLREGKDVAVLSLGPIGNEVRKAIDMITDEEISVAHYDMIYLKPIDIQILHEVGECFKTVITVEDGVRNGGLGSAVAEFMTENGYTPRIKRIGIPDQFIEHGTIEEQYKACGMDAESIYKILSAGH